MSVSSTGLFRDIRNLQRKSSMVPLSQDLITSAK